MAFAVFDIETQELASPTQSRLSLAVVWSSVTHRFRRYREDEVSQLVKDLEAYSIVVGFNLIAFDFVVLKNTYGFSLKNDHVLDIWSEVRRHTSRRVSLDALAWATLRRRKIGTGKRAVVLYQRGELDRLTEYCKRDVELTRDLFLFGVKHSYVAIPGRGGTKKKVAVNWPT